MNLNSWLEIDTKVFINNIKEINKIIYNNQQIALVVKSNAYGHDILKVSSIADKLEQVKYLCTASLSEAINLKKNNIKKPILVLSYIDDNLEKLVSYDIQVTIYDLKIAKEINNIANYFNKKLPINIKIDTGMSRLGIKHDKALEFIKKIQCLPNLKIIGIFTHLSDTSDPASYFNKYQIDNFNFVIKSLKKNNINIPNIHILSSSGIYLNDECANISNILRIGGLAYGLWKSEKHKNLILDCYPNLNIKPIASWKTRIIQIKEVNAGDYIGYNRTYKVKNKSKIAILPIGYFDGLPRNISNKGYVYINDMKAQIIGIVSMNLTIIDVTNINISLNQEVFIINNNIELSATNTAKRADTITNELVARIPKCIKRIFI